MDITEFTGKKFTTMDFVDFNLKRTNNTGNNVLLNTLYWEYSKNNNTFNKANGEFSEALLKLIDEVISNSVDIFISPPDIKFGKPGNTINVNIADNGEITVFNNGPGFPIYKDGNMYSVEQALSTQYTGTNYDDESEKILAGLNGQGIKLTNIYSKYFMVETVCYLQGVKYTQKFENNMRIVNAPVLETYKGDPYTKITFLLDFDKTCLTAKMQNSTNWINTGIEILRNIICRRCYESAAYLNLFSPLYKVYFNNTVINIDFNKFVGMHGNNYCTTTILPLVNTSQIPKKFNIGIIFKDPIIEKAKQILNPGFDLISIINNVVLTEVPNYVGVLLAKLETFLKNHNEFEKVTFTAIKTKFPGKLFRDNITFITIGSYPKNYFDFKGQTKTNANFDEKSLTEFKKNYVFSDEFLAQFWKKYKENIIKYVKPVNKTVKAKPKLYEPAQCIRSGKQAKAIFIAEGDSALQLMRSIIENNPQLSFNEYGLFSIQGVPINPIKSSNIYPQGPMQSEQLRENIGFQSLVNVLGLSYERSTTPKYKNIILATDQDEIGIGKISSLIICFFMVYFPDLVKTGFIMRYRTPIVRFYKSVSLMGQNENIVFYNEKTFEKWFFETKPEGHAYYYKGLGCHSKNEVLEMAQNFINDLIQINYDTRGEQLMYILFNTETYNRKIILSRGLSELDYKDELVINLYEHFMIAAVSEQLDNIRRMTPNVIDGLLPCQRKVIATVRNIKGSLKVSSLAGKVTSKMNYGYGEASLQGAIKYMAQIFPGSNRIPLLLPISDCNGTLSGGRKQNPAGRYCNVTTNSLMKYYYPIEDDDLLPLVFEEGEFYEPEYYCPIIPRILTEDTNNLATGWNSKYLARDFNEILKVVRESIINYPVVFCGNLYNKTSIYSGMSVKTFYNSQNKVVEYCFGTYITVGNTIVITQLPLHMWIEKFIKKITTDKDALKKSTKNNVKKVTKKNNYFNKYNDVVDYVTNESGANKTKITIYLKPGAWDKINENRIYENTVMSNIEEFFGLYKVFVPNLNFVYKGSIKSYANINSVFYDWFKTRRELYLKRIKKLKTLLKVKIELQENILHFITNNGGKIDKLEINEREEILSNTIIDCNFVKQFYKKSTQKGYSRLNHVFIQKKCNGSHIDLLKYVYTNGSYKYIYNIKMSKTSIPAINKLKLLISELYTEYNNIKKETWFNLWLNELNIFEQKYKECLNANWDYTKI